MSTAGRFCASPAWRLAAPVLARPARICAETTTHPKMMELLGSKWNSRKQLEFACYRAGIRAARLALDRADHQNGRRNLLLRSLDTLGLGLDT